MHETLLANKLGALLLCAADRLDGAFGDRSGSTVACLLTLGCRGPMSTTALAAILGLSQPATVRLVDRLAAEGLVERQPARGRQVPLALSQAGRQVADALQAQRLSVLDRLLAPLPPPDRAVLDRLLSVILAQAAATRGEARRLCRQCDHGVCDGPACPIGSALTARETGIQEAL